MFTQTCFIRKNTKELQDKLLKLGYEENTYASMKYSCLCADNYEDGYYDGESWQKTSDIPYYKSIKSEDYNSQDYGIDCGTNGISNLNPSCRLCNHYKSAEGLTAWRDWLLAGVIERLMKVYIFRVALAFGMIEIKNTSNIGYQAI